MGPLHRANGCHKACNWRAGIQLLQHCLEWYKDTDNKHLSCWSLQASKPILLGIKSQKLSSHLHKGSTQTLEKVEKFVNYIKCELTSTVWAQESVRNLILDEWG